VLLGCGDGAALPPGDAALVDAGMGDAGDIFACLTPPDPLPDCSAAAGGDGVIIEQGTYVAFHDACGQVMCTTDSGTGPAGPGIFASVNFVPDLIITFAGIEAGDRLNAGYPVAGPFGRSLDIEVPPFDGAAYYQASPGEGGNCVPSVSMQSPVGIIVGPSCRGGDDAWTILVTATDNAGQTLAYGWIRDADVPSSGTTVALEEWSTGRRSREITLTGIPPDVGEATIRARPVEDGVEYPCPFDCTDTQAVDSGGALLTVRVPADDAAQTAVSVDLVNQAGPESGRDMAVRVVGPLPAASTLDVTSQLLPHTTITSWDPDMARLEWVTASPPDEADALVVSIRWDVGEWYLVLPPGTGPVLSLPQLPTLVDPGSDPVPTAVMYFDSSEVDGYAEARPRVHILSVPGSWFWPYGAGYRHRISAAGTYRSLPD
jgi:hypothetical protein